MEYLLLSYAKEQNLVKLLTYILKQNQKRLSDLFLSVMFYRINYVKEHEKIALKMAYGVIMVCHLNIAYYILGIFVEIPK